MTDLHKLRLQIEKDRQAMAVREGRCPKCGSEMEYIGDAWIGGVHYQCNECGHEEKVTEGER